MAYRPNLFVTIEGFTPRIPIVDKRQVILAVSDQRIEPSLQQFRRDILCVLKGLSLQDRLIDVEHVEKMISQEFPSSYCLPIYVIEHELYDPEDLSEKFPHLKDTPNWNRLFDYKRVGKNDYFICKVGREKMIENFGSADNKVESILKGIDSLRMADKNTLSSGY